MLRTVEVGESCENGQSCVQGAICSSDEKICVCPPGETANEIGHCVPTDSPSRGSKSQQSEPAFTSGGSAKMASHKNDGESLIYGSGASADEGRFNQILTAKQM